jgi:hypothetical protein
VMVGVDAGWAGPTDDRWHTGAIDFPAGQEDPDGGEWLLELLLDDSPEAYRPFAEEYYELKSVDLATVSEVYALRPLTPAAGHHPQRPVTTGAVKEGGLSSV